MRITKALFFSPPAFSASFSESGSDFQFFEAGHQILFTCLLFLSLFLLGVMKYQKITDARGEQKKIGAPRWYSWLCPPFGVGSGCDSMTSSPVSDSTVSMACA